MSKYADDDDKIAPETSDGSRRARYELARLNAMKGAYALIKEHNLPDPEGKYRYFQVTHDNWKEIYEMFDVEPPDIGDEATAREVRRRETGEEFLFEWKDDEELAPEELARVNERRAMVAPD